MQRKEWTAGHICHVRKVRDAAMSRPCEPARAGGTHRVPLGVDAGLNPPMYRTPHRGLLPRQSRGHGPPGGGGGLLDPASGSAHVDFYAGTSPSWSRSPGAPRATPPHSETGS